MKFDDFMDLSLIANDQNSLNKIMLSMTKRIEIFSKELVEIEKNWKY